MRLRIALLALLVAAPAFAQDAQFTPAPPEAPAPAASPAAPTPVPAAGPLKFYLEVDQNDLAAISAALNELPKKVADPLILKLNAQLGAQAPIIEAKATAEKVRKGKKHAPN